MAAVRIALVGRLVIPAVLSALVASCGHDRAPPSTLERDTEALLTQPRGLRFDDDGILLWRWRAQTALRHRDGSTTLEQPFYTGTGEPPWTVSAEQALLSGDEQQLELTKHVIVRNLPPEAQIETEYLRLDLATSRAWTDRPLSLTRGGTVTTAVGLSADLNHRSLELLSQVHGDYAPE